MKREGKISQGDVFLKEFQVILALEEEAAQAYHQLALDCPDPDVGLELEKISQDERKHARIALNLVRLVRKCLKAKLEKKNP
ncbi:MAG: hypothetical protein U1F57_09285 [bacterium]